jgi:hypothetical protein
VCSSGNTEEEWCIEWTWHIEHKRKKNRKCKDVCMKTLMQIEQGNVAEQ